MLCFAVALLEGFDIQAPGVVAPQLMQSFGLRAEQMGWLLSASTFGLLFGALLGGRLADLIGRKIVLVGCVAVFGLFSLLTVVSHGLPALIAMRFFTGLGMGGAMPNLIALTAEVSRPELRARTVTAMYSGIPLGAALAGSVSLLAQDLEWRAVFLIGGVAPLVLVLVLLRCLPESSLFQALRLDQRQGTSRGFLAALGGEGRSFTTLLLWVASFFTLMGLFLLVNWLPTLLIDQGFRREQATLASVTFNLGGVGGSLVLAHLMSCGSRRWVLTFAYGGIAAAISALGLVTGNGPMFAAALAAGFFVVGGQFVIYGLTPGYYPTLLRGTGVGAMVAIGRIGAISGPILAGYLLSAGFRAETLFLSILPPVACAWFATFLLMRRPEAKD